MNEQTLIAALTVLAAGGSAKEAREAALAFERDVRLRAAAPELLSTLQRIVGVAKEARISVNDVQEAKSGLNRECAAAVTRGYCLTLERIAEAAIATANG